MFCFFILEDYVFCKRSAQSRLRTCRCKISNYFNHRQNGLVISGRHVERQAVGRTVERNSSDLDISVPAIGQESLRTRRQRERTQAVLCRGSEELAAQAAYMRGSALTEGRTPPSSLACAVIYRYRVRSGHANTSFSVVQLANGLPRRN